MTRNEERLQWWVMQAEEANRRARGSEWANDCEAMVAEYTDLVLREHVTIDSNSDAVDARLAGQQLYRENNFALDDKEN